MKLINKLLLILILILNFQALTKADDISEFEIEGISIGESVLKYYSKKKIYSLPDQIKVIYPNK